MVVWCMVGNAWAESGHDHQGKSEAVTVKKNVSVTGEVIDITCYVSHGGKGEHHKECGVACIDKGLAIGLLEEKTDHVYLVATDKHEPANKILREYFAKKITVKGTIHEGRGVDLLIMSKITKK